MNRLTTELKNNYVKMPKEALQDCRLTVYEKAVLGFLACYSEPSFSIDQIREALGVSRWTVNKALKNLRQNNVVTWRTGHYGMKNIYTINPPSEWWAG